jgi:undecaprenyl diphosphate synthase
MSGDLAVRLPTENWKRSPDEVRFLMNFNRDFIRKTRNQLRELGIRVRWVGRMPRLWKSLQVAQEQTKGNVKLTLYFCMNYGGRAELADAMQAMAQDVQAGRLDPAKVSEKTIPRSTPALAERVRRDGLPERAVAGVDRRDLRRACLEFASRDRRLGGAIPNEELPAVEGRSPEA